MNSFEATIMNDQRAPTRKPQVRRGSTGQMYGNNSRTVPMNAAAILAARPSAAMNDVEVF